VKKRLIIIGCVIILALLVVVIYNHASNQNMLSTGLRYEFRGGVNLNEFREEYFFHWEREVDGIIIATTPTEAAELGQVLLAPMIKENQELREYLIAELWIVVVNYCNATNNWVLSWDYPEAVRLSMGLMATHIFALNRTNGRITEYFDNSASLLRSDNELIADGWIRTINI